MTIMKLEGSGIISGTFDTEELERRREEERRQAAEYDRAMKAQTAREQEQRATVDEMESTLLPHIKREIAEEMAAQTPSPLAQYASDCAAFRACAERWDLPYLPAPPQMVAIYLSESEGGLEHVKRQVRAISAWHRATNHPDPTGDILVRAILRLCEKENEKKGTH
jgi:hypothetical protein